MYRTIALLVMLALGAACDDGNPSGGDADGDADGDGDLGDAEMDADRDGDEDDGGGDADTDADEDEDVELSYCEELGLEPRDFIDAEEDTALYALAADFTVPTTDGDWTLSQEWTGCDSYLFIQDHPQQNSDWPDPIWSRDMAPLLARTPRNTHLFFASTATNPEDRDEALAELQDRLDGALGSIPEADRAWQAARVHVITQATTLVGGWLARVWYRPGWGVGIDRFQRIRYIGSYSHHSRYDPSRDWPFGPSLTMAANEAIYYNFEAERAARLASQDATVIQLFDGDELSDPGWAGSRGYAEVDLPDAAALAAFDTLELDLYLGCVGHGELGDCPAWDYIVNLYLCDADDPETCDTELGRWITTYHREGRWVHDVSGLLPLLGEGGRRRFAFYTQQPYEVDLSLRLSNQGRGTRPAEATELFSGGGFGPDYNDRYEPIAVEIPGDAARVELAVVISGHGMAEPGNCAEFCATTHHFEVNGEENVVQFPSIGNDDGCLEQVDRGTVPNQYGTWWFGRSGWCPGLEVPVTTIDITGQVDLGAENTFEYQGFFRGEPYPAGGARIDIRSWVVVWR